MLGHPPPRKGSLAYSKYKKNRRRLARVAYRREQRRTRAQIIKLTKAVEALVDVLKDSTR